MKFEIDILRPNHERGGNDPNDWTTVPRIFHSPPEIFDALAVLLFDPSELHDAIRIRRIEQ